MLPKFSSLGFFTTHEVFIPTKYEIPETLGQPRTRIKSNPMMTNFNLIVSLIESRKYKRGLLIRDSRLCWLMAASKLSNFHHSNPRIMKRAQFNPSTRAHSAAGSTCYQCCGSGSISFGRIRIRYGSG